MNDSVKLSIESYIRASGLGDPGQFKHIFAPGRVEVLGKHTDYAGGSSIVAALSIGIGFAYRPRTDSLIEVHATDLGDTAVLDATGSNVAEGHWSAYFDQVAKRVFNNFPGRNTGATIIVSSSLPPAAGMSSSSAVVIGAFLCLADLNDCFAHEAFKANIRSRLDLADYLSTVENGGSYRHLSGNTGVGTLGGSEDHTAILASLPLQLGWFNYRPTELRKYIPFPDGLDLALISSGVVAEKSGSAREDYNRSARLCHEIVQIWNRETGSEVANVGSMLNCIDFSISSLRKLFTRMNRDDLALRFEHFYREETVHIPNFVSAVSEGDYERMGTVISQSFADADALLGNQTEETRALVRIAESLGALGASAFGAGFGGSVYALVRQDAAATFLADWKKTYLQQFPQHVAGVEAFIDRPQKGTNVPASFARN
ncbi:MAG: galactokinase [Rhodothermales bacterium]|nr:galactokinase [Rhodothermales bacterium]